MQIRTAAQLPGDLARAGEVAGVLLKYGLAGWLHDTGWEPLRHLLSSHSGQVLTDQPFAVRVRLAMTDLGTTFVKLGQVLSTRPDLVGPDVAHELAKLRSGAPADPPEVARATVEAELGRPIKQCFRDFDPVPIASASIAQVHRARLRNGRAVAVKVQHPNIETRIRQDLNILANLAALADRRDELHRYEPVAVVREFRQTMLRELDFRREMFNLRQFRRNFATDERVVFPRPYPNHSTSRVLTMQFLQGKSVSELEDLKTNGVHRDEAARGGAGVYIEMIFRDGFYHADPHPGNILVLDDGRVGILDCGMTGRIDDALRRQIIEVLMAAGERDGPRLATVIARTCKAPINLDQGSFSADVMDLFTQYGVESIDKMDISGALTSVTRLIHDYRLVMPSRISMLIKCLILLEGTGKALSAHFNLAEVLEPYRRKYIRQQLSPATWLTRLKRLRRDWQMLAESIPHDLASLLDQLQRGKLSVQLRLHTLESSVNRLVYGLFTSALLLSSALMWSMRVPPTIHGYSVMGLLGYLAAILLGTRLMWLIHRDDPIRKDRREQ